MHVVGPRLPAAKELSTWHTLLPTVSVPRSLERGNVVRTRRVCRAACHDIENRLRAHTWNGGTAGVFQVQRERPTRAEYSLPFRSEERRPASVVLDEPYDTRFKTEGVSDRLAQRRAPSGAPTPAQRGLPIVGGCPWIPTIRPPR